MPTYLFWGDDAFRLDKAVQSLKDRVLRPEWSSFNLDKVEPSASSGGEAFVQGLNQAMTPPFGQGDRLVWLVNPPLSGSESSVFVAEVERTLPVLPATTHLLFTYEGKPDGRSKITKLLQQGTVTEFTLTPPWKTDVLRRTVQQVAQELRVSLTDAAADLIAEAVGNDTRLLFSELEKLKLYLAQPDGQVGTITPEAAKALMSTTQQSSLELANAVRQGLTDRALGLAEDLLRCNEPPLRIVATLIKQFRTWLWVKLMVVSGERDERVIAKAADIANPKRIYFLTQDVSTISVSQLRQSLSLLLDLEVALKQGQEPRGTLHTKVIELCRTCSALKSSGTMVQKQSL